MSIVTYCKVSGGGSSSQNGGDYFTRVYNVPEFYKEQRKPKAD